MELKVRCPICGSYIDRIDRKHAKAHGYSTLKEFMQTHGIKYKTVFQRSRQKLQSLYNIDNKRWNLVYFTVDGDWRYVAKSYSKDYEVAKKLTASASRFPLSDNHFNRHFDGRNPLAIFAYGTHSRFFGFDVDSEGQAPTHTLQLVKALVEEGIPREHIHVSFSGGKGYHIELFIDGHIRFEDWALFAAYIKDKAGLTDNKKIEHRPTATNGHAWKLPLTYHHKTGSFAGYCDNETLGVYDEQTSHDYLFKIQPMNKEEILTVLEKARAAEAEIKRRIAESKRAAEEDAKQKRVAVKVLDERVFRTAEEKERTAIERLKYGLVEVGTRHAVTITIAQYLYFVAGYPTDDIMDILIRWTDEQAERGLVESTRDKYIKDIEGILHWIETKNTGFFPMKKELEITRGEIDWVMQVKDRSARDLLFALLLFSKAYDSQNFFLDRRRLEKLLRMSPHTIKKSRVWLENNGYISVKLPTKREAFAKRRATTYRILFEPSDNPIIVDTIRFDDETNCRELLRSIAEKLYTPQQLRSLRIA